MQRGVIIGGVIVVMVCCSSSVAAVMMGGDGESNVGKVCTPHGTPDPNATYKYGANDVCLMTCKTGYEKKDGACVEKTTGPSPSGGSPGPADGTPCDSGMTGRDNHYMNGECVYKGCSPGYSDVNGTCISARWYLPGGVGPHYRKYLSKKPSESCQANGEWKILDSRYFDKKLNCADTDCLDDGSYNFCFKRQSENECNGSASGYYGRNPEERTLMEDGGRDDRVKDCVWVAGLPSSKVFNSEAEYASVASDA